VPVLYSTIGNWTLYGFYQPVDMSTTVMLLNTIKGGQTVPLKFNVFAGTVEQTNVSGIAGFTVQEVACMDVGTSIDDVDFVTTGATELRYDGTPGSGGQFIQNWQTPKAANMCYRNLVTTSDSSVLAAFFKTKEVTFESNLDAFFKAKANQVCTNQHCRSCSREWLRQFHGELRGCRWSQPGNLLGQQDYHAGLLIKT
jgi:hypothetical protein